jgi:hypothetical protein
MMRLGCINLERLLVTLGCGDGQRKSSNPATHSTIPEPVRKLKLSPSRKVPTANKTSAIILLQAKEVRFNFSPAR